MRRDINPGATFPDYELPDPENVVRILSDLPTASMTNHARWFSGSQSPTSGGIRNDCSRSHATKRWPITKWS
jgi:hypothetical protein